ncbi:bifunctional UDP-N-acetylglucosamine diphosphorylase/glucosamine-1-phosphate N-acetyltransferase GlmU [Actinopolymorpha pittospori]|uniref:Bifunctional protein GlmU n=2 Tax=Actinopolymorpha pittospori TaxID=648752 RepID=A0A927N5B5_9ACTN|nr:bifunctional UDP-N-acetylglucosamine pyrophosphorylase/glucosamine-1-phosphate N-acetyltransferase [Actinopolymorpha pittospori]
MIATVKPAAVIVLAAGEGKRMKSRTPKMLHELGGRSLVGHATAAGRALEPGHLVVVVGHGRDQVTAHLAALDPTARPVVQAEQLGTGHAVRTALEALPPLAGTVVVTNGDVPLLTPDTLRALLATHQERGAAATVLTAVVPDPTGYGRILRAPDGSVEGIVEHRDATDEQRAVAEINSGMFAFDAVLLADALGKLSSDNSQGEEYLTDVLGILRAEGHRVDAVVAEDDSEILGVNDRVQLAELGRLLNERILTAWMRSGVTVIDPATTWVDASVTLEPDVTLYPQTQLRGATTVAAGAHVGPDTTLTDTTVGPDARVVRTHGEGAVIGAGANVGPFAYLRPGTNLGEAGKIGTFVETKNAEIGPGAKVPHLSYVGDATIGAATNIGAGTIFANYDGVHKNRTEVGSHSFVGSDSVLVAPRKIADGAYIAAGSTVVKDVGPGELAVARGQQRNVAGWVARKRAGTPTAEAAARAAGQQTDTADAPARQERQTGDVDGASDRSEQ